jgi:uncharacterized protein YkwD
VAVVGDVFAVAPRADAGLPPPDDIVVRAAPLPRGDRLLHLDLTLDFVTVAAVAPEPETQPEPDPAIAEPAQPPPPEPTSRPAPQPTAAPAPILALPATPDAELRMLVLMNASRLQGGLVPLALDAGVSETARRHSTVESQHRYVYHDGPDGTAASRDAPACGSGWYGENTGKVWSGGVDVLHREFMAEPWVPINHRTNIMDPSFRRAGIGAVQGPDAVYITVVFCR